MARRDEIAIFIGEYAIDHGGNSPSIQEIADALGICKRTAEIHLIKLASENRTTRRDGKLILIGAEFSPPPPILR
jgi:hypothetical protein